MSFTNWLLNFSTNCQAQNMFALDCLREAWRNRKDANTIAQHNDRLAQDYAESLEVHEVCIG